MLRTLALLGAAALCAGSAAGAQAPLPLKRAPQPTVPAITPADLMSRLYVFADDSMMGREAGTPDNLRGTAYIERELRRIGLTPAGDAGTFFQNVPLVRRVPDEAATLSVDGARLARGTDYLPRDQGYGARSLDGVQAVYGGTWGVAATLLPATQAAGKLVVLAIPRGPKGEPVWPANRALITARFHSAAGIAYASLDAMPAAVQAEYRASTAELDTGKRDSAALPAWVYVTRGTARRLLGVPADSASPGLAGRTVLGGIPFVDGVAPARNVVAVLPGSDPRLRGEYVAVGAHNDHIGFVRAPLEHDSLRAFNSVMRPHGAEDEEVGTPTPAQAVRIRALTDSLHRLHPARPDSIFNGADDDGSGTVSVLEIAEALKRQGPAPRRSILFVWHTGEELGLYGSQWYTDHPTVPRDSVVAQLNIDMIGRGGAADLAGGGPTYLQLIGSRRLSTELGDVVEAVNRTEARPFAFDYQFDANGHPSQYYCRSDHYEYARYGIPITFFSTGGHQDYHQLTDEPQYIDYAHMARVATLVRDVAVRLANLDHRVVVDKPKPDPQGECRQ
ncbi:MAG: peptidase [Gemmatimonadetes bacterium]|nr:peptidase [Gemmatimonadota bacterium]